MRAQKAIKNEQFPIKKRKKLKKAESFALPILTSARQIGPDARKTAIRIPKSTENRVPAQRHFTRIYTQNDPVAALLSG